MSPRRGLTLIEVLAATAMLALVTVTCVPLLSAALEALPAPEAQLFDRVDLRQLADDVLDDPAAFGIESPESITEVTVAWPDQFERPAVTVRRLRSSEEEPSGHWLQFACQNLLVHRWIKAEEAPEEPEP